MLIKGAFSESVALCSCDVPAREGSPFFPLLARFPLEFPSVAVNALRRIGEGFWVTFLLLVVALACVLGLVEVLLGPGGRPGFRLSARSSVTALMSSFARMVGPSLKEVGTLSLLITTRSSLLSFMSMESRSKGGGPRRRVAGSLSLESALLLIGEVVGSAFCVGGAGPNLCEAGRRSGVSERGAAFMVAALREA